MIALGTVAAVLLYGLGHLISKHSHHLRHSQTVEVVNVAAFVLMLAAGFESVTAGIGRWPVSLIHFFENLLPGGWGLLGQAVLTLAALGMGLRIVLIAVMRESAAGGGGGGGMRGGGGGGGVSAATRRIAFFFPITLAAVGTGALAVIYVYMLHISDVINGFVTAHL